MSKKIKIVNKSGFDFKRATDSSAGYDLVSTINYPLQPKEIKLIPTGIFWNGTDDMFAMITSRSGMAKKGIVVNNAPGIVDADYFNEFHVMLYNQTDELYNISTGDRIAQVIFMPYYVPIIKLLESEEELEKGQRVGGFGSTGK